MQQTSDVPSQSGSRKYEWKALFPARETPPKVESEQSLGWWLTLGFGLFFFPVIALASFLNGSTIVGLAVSGFVVFLFKDYYRSAMFRIRDRLTGHYLDEPNVTILHEGAAHSFEVIYKQIFKRTSRIKEVRIQLVLRSLSSYVAGDETERTVTEYSDQVIEEKNLCAGETLVMGQQLNAKAFFHVLESFRPSTTRHCLIKVHVKCEHRPQFLREFRWWTDGRSGGWAMHELFAEDQARAAGLVRDTLTR